MAGPAGLKTALQRMRSADPRTQGQDMSDSQVQRSDAQEVPRPFREPTPVATVVRRMTREIQRLHDDNLQLRAAINIYREVVRQYTERAS